MSAIGLRIDCADTNSPNELISKCFPHKSVFITVILCLRAIGIVLPRDIRRKIVLSCCKPFISQMDCTLQDYWKFYLSHETTRQYNPILHNNISSAIHTGTLLMTHLLIDKSTTYDFHHPTMNNVRNGPRHVCGNYKLALYDFPEERGETFIYQRYIPKFGDTIIGLVHDDCIISATIYATGDKITNSPLVQEWEIYRSDLKSVLPMISFRFTPEDFGNADYDPDKMRSMLCSDRFLSTPPIIHPFKDIVMAAEYVYPALSIRIVTNKKTDKITLIYGFLPHM